MTRLITNYRDCPICNERVEFTDWLSCYISSTNLDFKANGEYFVHAKCKNCNFVFDIDFFTEEEINILRDKLKENDIFKNEPDMPDFYYFAKECELVNMKAENILYKYICAIWDGIKDKNIFEKISNIIFNYSDNIPKEHENYYSYQLIKLDLLRRLGEFKSALNLIEILNNEKDFPHDKFNKVLTYQTTLINQKDTDEHEMPK